MVSRWNTQMCCCSMLPAPPPPPRTHRLMLQQRSYRYAEGSIRCSGNAARGITVCIKISRNVDLHFLCIFFWAGRGMGRAWEAVRVVLTPPTFLPPNIRGGYRPLSPPSDAIQRLRVPGGRCTSLDLIVIPGRTASKDSTDSTSYP